MTIRWLQSHIWKCFSHVPTLMQKLAQLKDAVRQPVPVIMGI